VADAVGVALVVLVGALQMQRADAGLVTMAATFQPKRTRSRHSLLYREEHGAAGRHHNVFMPIAIAKALSWGGPSEVFVFGAVHIGGSPETYRPLFPHRARRWLPHFSHKEGECHEYSPRAQRASVRSTI